MKIKLTSNRYQNIYSKSLMKFFDVNVEYDLNENDAVMLWKELRDGEGSSKSNIQMLSKFNEYDKTLWENDKVFNFVTNIDRTSGWGTVSYNLLNEISKIANPRWIGIEKGVEQDLLSKLDTNFATSGLVVMHEQPKDYWATDLFDKKVGILPFETTKIPASWVDRINHLDGLIVPCVQNIKMMKDSGVTVPIRLVHWGVEKDKFYPIEKTKRDVFSIGSMGALSIRKGSDLLVQAFSIAFPPHIKDVELIMKTSHRHYQFMTGDKRIKPIVERYTHDELLHKFFGNIDVFALPTRGEGFGLPVLEAMATSTPVITTNWSGPVDFVTDNDGWLLDYKMVPADNFTNLVYKEDCGDWAEPDLEQLVETLRDAYNNRDKVIEKGQHAAKTATEWHWDKKIHMFYDAIDEFSMYN